MNRLIFVYNADGGAWNAIMDAAHKALSPQTYECALCAITYGAVSMRREWKDYVSRLPMTTLFLHRDEFRRAFSNSTVELPAILLEKESGDPIVLVGAEQMQLGQSVTDLTVLLDRALARQAGQAV